MVKPRSYLAYGIMVAVLVLGVVIGAGAMYAYLRRQTELAAGQDTPRARREKVEALSRELSLSDAQRTKIDAILEANRDERTKRMRAMYEACGEPVREHKKRVDAEIRATLTPEQQKKFDVLADEQDKKYFPQRDGKADQAP